MASSIPRVLSSPQPFVPSTTSSSPFVLAETRNNTVIPLGSPSRFGAAVIATAGGISAISSAALILYILIVSTRLARIIKRGKEMTTEQVFLRTRIGFYVLSLIFCGLLGGLGALLNVEWASRGLIMTGNTCTAQGIMLQSAGVAMALFQIFIAFHTFSVLVLKKMMPITTIIISIALAWIIAGIVAFVGPIKDKSFYHAVGLWCWIANNLPYAQFLMLYLPTFIADGAVLILYFVVFLHLRGNLSIRENLTFALHRSPKDLSRDEYRGFLGLIAVRMFWYPLFYIILFTPLAICRMLELRGLVVADAVWVFSATAAALIGCANVIVFLVIRTAKQQSSGDTPVKPRRKYSDKDSIASFIGGREAGPQYPVPAFARPASKVWTPPPLPRFGFDANSRTPSRASSVTVGGSVDLTKNWPTPPMPRTIVDLPGRFSPAPRLGGHSRSQGSKGSQGSTASYSTLSEVPRPTYTPPPRQMTNTSPALRTLAHPESNWNGTKPVPGPLRMPPLSLYPPTVATALTEASRYSTTTAAKEREVPAALRPAGSPQVPSSDETSANSAPSKESSSDIRESTLISLYKAFSPIPPVPPLPSRTPPPVPANVESSGNSSSPVRRVADWRAKIRAARPIAPALDTETEPNQSYQGPMTSGPMRNPPPFDIQNGPYSAPRDNASPSYRYVVPNPVYYDNNAGPFARPPAVARGAQSAAISQSVAANSPSVYPTGVPRKWPPDSSGGAF